MGGSHAGTRVDRFDLADFDNAPYVRVSMGDDLQACRDLQISMFAGEAEGRFDLVLRDAAAGKLAPVYDFIKDLPDIEGTPVPFLPKRYVARTLAVDPPGGSFAGQILAGLTRSDGRGEAALVEPLTDRELMVLQSLPTMASNAEIRSPEGSRRRSSSSPST